MAQMVHQKTQYTRTAPFLKELGYEARQVTPVDLELGLAMYMIKEPQYMGHLAILSVATDGEHAPSTLFVNFVDMTIDSRGEAKRPRLRQLLVAFWTDSVCRSLQQLRRIVFQNVTEKLTRLIVRERVAALMNVGYSHFFERPCDNIVLTAPEATSIAQATEAWHLICRHSRLVRCVMSLLRDFFPTGKPDEQVAAVQIVICPTHAFNQACDAHNFNLEVILGKPGRQQTETRGY